MEKKSHTGAISAMIALYVIGGGMMLYLLKQYKDNVRVSFYTGKMEYTLPEYLDKYTYLGPVYYLSIVLLVIAACITVYLMFSFILTPTETTKPVVESEKTKQIITEMEALMKRKEAGEISEVDYEAEKARLELKSRFS